MSAEARTPRAWAGKWIAAVGLLHLVAGFLLYPDAWATIRDRGIIASINDHDPTATAFWFMAAAPLLIILGFLIDWAEKRGGPPRWLGWALVVLLIVMIVPMPMTGAWLVVPPTLGLLLRRA